MYFKFSFQFGAWASWACCVGLCVFATLKLCRYHQEENMRVSMAKARERLLKGTNTNEDEAAAVDAAVEPDRLKNISNHQNESMTIHSV
jgi:hypothetical protein